MSGINWWWLSFVDETKSAPYEEQIPGEGGFLGVCIVQGRNIKDAADHAWDLGINPGGQVGGQILHGEPPARWVNRFIPKDEACALADADGWDI